MRLLFVACLTSIAIAAAACGGNSGSTTPTAAPPTAPPTIVGTPTIAASTPRPAHSPSARVFTAAEAQTIVANTALLPPDLLPGWKLQTDTTVDNPAAAAADPAGAAAQSRCGRLLGRTAVSQPFDVVPAFLAGDSVSRFSSVTVYATEAGAIDCEQQAAARYQQPGELARAFGNVFVDANKVVVTPVDYPKIGDSSFAADLSGQVDASGTVVDITILVVAFRVGNITAVVGSASSGAPPVDDLKPYVERTLKRVAGYVE